MLADEGQKKGLREVKMGLMKGEDWVTVYSGIIALMCGPGYN